MTELDAATVTLPAVATIREIAAIHESVLAALNAVGKVHIDARAVEEADLCFFQLLLSAAASAREGASATFAPPQAPAVRDQARLCGLATLFDQAGD